MAQEKMAQEELGLWQEVGLRHRQTVGMPPVSTPPVATPPVGAPPKDRAADRFATARSEGYAEALRSASGKDGESAWAARKSRQEARTCLSGTATS